mmetsp:Transcript_9676/g.18594  ORF Transcript_9676/g.18594 Transcript_9676/m.18594 type:complete len:248 (+) Transcript_9676:260-1003(+)
MQLDRHQSIASAIFAFQERPHAGRLHPARRGVLMRCATANSLRCQTADHPQCPQKLRAPQLCEQESVLPHPMAYPQPLQCHQKHQEGPIAGGEPHHPAHATTTHRDGAEATAVHATHLFLQQLCPATPAQRSHLHGPATHSRKAAEHCARLATSGGARGQTRHCMQALKGPVPIPQSPPTACQESQRVCPGQLERALRPEVSWMQEACSLPKDQLPQCQCVEGGLAMVGRETYRQPRVVVPHPRDGK